MDNINIERARTIAHSFYFCVSAGKASLLPFLPLYFRYLGLTAFQTGLVIGVQNIVSVFWAPLWIICANYCNRRRFILMFSIFICILSRLLLTLAPSSDVDFAMSMCNRSTSLIANDTSIAIPVATSPMPPTLLTTNSIPSTQKLPNFSVNQSTHDNDGAHRSTTTEIPTVKNTFLSTTPKLPSTQTIMKTTKEKQPHYWDRLSSRMQALITNLGYTKKDINSMSDEEFSEVVNEIGQILNASDADDDDRVKRDLIASTFASINQKLSEIQAKIENLHYRAFLVVLIILLGSELFSAPIERMADKLWFEFLDGLDFVERYGTERVWSTLGLIIFPLTVTAIVDNTSCLLFQNISHFMIHFYTFAVITGVAFVLAFYFPIFTEKKLVRRNSTLKGCKILCNDLCCFCIVVTVLLGGMITAMLDNFLFWKVEDLHGSEIFMGGSIAIAGVTQFFMYAISKFLLRKFSAGGMIIFALFVLALRLVLYSFMWAPWPVLIIAVLHGFSDTLLWVAVENYPDFKLNPLVMDRSAKTVIFNIYRAFGYGGGSILAGYLYDVISFNTMLQGAAIMALIWCLIYAIVLKCSPRKNKFRYAKLLQAEEDQDSEDESTIFDGDWFEVALKQDK